MSSPASRRASLRRPGSPPSSQRRRQFFFESLEERRVMTTNLNFDGDFAPEAFSMQQPLANEYAAEGAVFEGVNGAGWEVLNEQSHFGVEGYSSPNFLTWNSDVTSLSERVSFSSGVSHISLQVGSTQGGTFSVKAFNAFGTQLGSSTVSLTGTMQTLSLPYSNVAALELSTNSWFGVLDNLQYDVRSTSIPAVGSVAAIDADGNLTISDPADTPNSNNLQMTSAGDYLVFNDPWVPFTTLPSAGSQLRDGGYTLAVPAADVTGSVIVLSGEGDDTLLVDFSGGNPVPSGGLSFDGGAQETGTGDTLILSGGTYEKVHHYSIGPFNTGTGFIDLGDDGIDIAYTGLEPVLDNTVVADRIFTINNAVTDAVLDDNGVADGSSRLRFTSNAFEDVVFTNPTNSITINTQGGSLVQLGAMDSAYNPGTITFNGQATDNFRLTANEVIPNAAAFNLNGAANLDLNSFTETLGGLFGSGVITNGSATASTIAVGANNATSLFTGRIQNGTTTGGNVVNFTKTGNATFYLLGNNTYTGTTTIAQGTLSLGATAPVAGALYQLDATQLGTLFQDAAGTVAVTASGQPIGNWKDPLNARNFTQATAAKQPLYQTGAINGKPAIVFDGVASPNSDQLVFGTALNQQSVFIVNRPNAVQNGIAGIWGVNGVDTGIRINPANNWFHPGNGNDFTNAAGSTFFTTGVAGGAFTAGAVQFLEALRSSPLSVAATGLGDYTNGAFGNRAYTGAIGEVLVYGTALTADQRMQNEAYLFGKWLSNGVNYLSDSTSVVIANGATFDLGGLTESVGSLATDAAGSTGANVQLGSGSLGVGTNNSNTMYAGTISGSGSLVKYGTGQLSLTNGGSTYSGATTINNGSIRVTANGALGTVAGGTTVNAGAALVLDAVNYSNAEPLSIAGTGTAANGALLAQNGTSTFAGPVTMSNTSVVNVAAGKTATQISDQSAAANASVAVDGINSLGGAHPGASHTNGGSVGGMDWWQVDLGSSFSLSSMNVANRTDCCGFRLDDYWVFVSDAPFLSTDTPATLTARANTYANHQLQRQPNVVASVPLNGATGRYLRIQAGVNTVFSLAEVQVFSTVAATTSQTRIGTAAGADTLNLTGAVNTTAGSTLQFAGSGSQVLSGVVSGSGPVNKYGSGQVTLANGANSYTGVTTVGEGSLRVTANGALGTVAGGTNVLPGGSLVFDNVNYAALEPVSITGTGAAGAGAIVGQNGTSTFAGPVTVNSAALTNVALGKTATQNSTLAAPQNNASVAVDGLFPNGAAYPNVTHTNTAGSTGGLDWWDVDLRSTFSLSSMNVANRTDCCGNRLADYWVFVSDSPFLATDTPTILANRANTYSNHQLFQPNPVSSFGLGTSGRYLRIQVNVSTVFSLAEVQVFSMQAAATSSTTIGTAAAADTLNLTGTVGNATAGSTLQFAGTGTVAVGSTISGAGPLVKNGTGTLVLSGANTYTGATTINAGTLTASSNAALGTTAAGTTVNSGGTLRITGSGLVIPESLTVSGTGVASAGAIVNTANANQITGATSTPASVGGIDVRINSDAGTLTLGDMNLGTATYTFGGAGNIAVAGNISDSPAVSAGRFVQITNNGGVSRNLQLSELEAFLVGVAPAGGFDPANNVMLNTNPGAGYFSSGPAGIAHGTTASLNDGVAAGGGTSFNLDPGVGNNIVMTLGTDRSVGRVRLWQRNDGCCQDRLMDFTVSLLANNGGVPGAIVAKAVFPGQVPTNLFSDINLVLSQGSIVKDGAGTVTLSGTNTYAGATTVTTGTLTVASNGALGATAGGTTVNSGAALRIGGSGLVVPENLTLNGTGIASGGALVNTANANQITGAISTPIASGSADVRINSDAGTLTLGNINMGYANYLFGGAGNIVVNGSISDGSAGTTARFIQITNNGTASRNLQLSEIEAFLAGAGPVAGFDPANNVQLNTNPGAGYFASGPATIAHGTTASINDGVPAGGATSFNLNPGVANFITMTLGQDRGIGRVRLWQRNDGCCQDRLSDFTVSLLANNAGVPGAVVAANLFAGQVATNSFADINFAANIVKDGSGTVTFGGTNNYNGTTTINAGTLVAASNGALGTTTANTTVNSGGALRVTGSGLAIPENVSISGTGVTNGGAIVNTANANSLTGTISVPSSVGTGDVRINSDAGTLTLANSVEIGSARLFVGGAGNVALNGVTENHRSRFIKVMNNGAVARNLQLSEIEAFLIGVAPAAGLDAANDVLLNTNPGAGYVSSGPVGIAHGATNSINDGVLAGGGTSFNVDVGVGDFIIMTLGQDRNIGRVRLWQRNDGCCQDRLMDFTVSLLDSSNTLLSSTSFPGQVPTNSFSDVSFTFAAGSFVKDGSGAATLNGNNYTFAGNTTINGGTLLVNGTLPNNTTNPDVTVNNTGTLGGTGTVGGTTQVASGGKIAPGTSPGVLAAGDVTFTSGSTFAPEINGTVVGTGYDQLNVTGAVTLGNATLTPAGTFVPNGAVFNSFTVINNDLADPIVGTFNGLPQNAPVGLNGGTLYVSYTGGTGNDVVLSTQILGGAGDDTLVMRRLNATTNEYSINGAAFISISNTLPFAYNGGGGNDLVWIDTTNGDPIPTGDITLSSVEFVRVEKTGAASDSATVTPASITIPGYGAIVFNGAQVVDVVNFTGVTVNTATTNDSLTIVNGNTVANTGTLPAGYALTALADVQVAAGGFIVGSGNVGTLTVDTVVGGGNGNDTVTVTSANNAHGLGNLFIATGTGTDSIVLNGEISVTNIVSLVSGGSIGSPSAANDVLAASLVAAASTGIDLDTTVGAATITNTGAGNATIDNVGALNLLGFNVANGNGTITATAGLTDAGSAIVSVSGTANLSATSITLGETGTDSLNFGNVTFNSAGAVVISENSSMSIVGTNTAASVDLDSTAGISDATATSVVVTGLADVNGTSISLGGGIFNAGTLTFNSVGAVVVAEDSAMNIVGTNTAASVDLDSTAGISDATATSVVVTGLVDVNGTSISLGGGIFNAGTLTFSSAGAVVVAEDSSLSLTGTNTAASADLDSTGSISDAGATSVVVTGLLDVSGTSISLGGGIFNAGTTTFNSAGAVVIGEDSSIDIVGVNTAASADLDAVGAISDSGATSVNVTGLVDVNGGAIALGGGIFNAGTLTFVSTAAVSITEDSNLNLVGANTATGSVTLATTDSAASENISLPLTASLSGAGVTLNAGDDAIVAGSISSTSDVTINVDVGGAIDVTGGAANITGVVSTPVANFTFVNGNVQDDSITITPSLATEFRVFGDLPTGTTTGDELHMNVTGLNATLSAPGTVGIYTGAGSGDWSFGTGQRPVRFGSIEELDAPGALFHLIYNNDVTQAANLVVMLGTGGTNLEIRSGSNAGPVLLALASASVQSLTVNGNNAAVAEQVTIDDVNGLPEFASTPTLSPDNAVVTGLPGIYFQGNLGTNTLAFNLVQASTSQIVGLGDGTTGAPDANAEVATTNGAGDAVNVFGSSLANILRTGVGPTPGALSVQAEGGNDTINVSAGGGSSTNIAATGYTTFNFSAVNTYSAVTVNGNGGNDSLTLVSLGGAANTTPVTLDGGVGNDVLGVGTGGSLAAVLAPVTLVGGADTDVANVDNSASVTANNTTVRENQIDGITGRNSSADVSFGGVETLSVFTSGANDTITINMDAAPGGNVVTATINGSGGNDTFVFASAADPTLATLNLQGGTGDDTFGTAPSGGIGSPPLGGEFVPTSGVQIVISGESSTSTSGPNPTGENDQLNLNISAFTTAEVVDAGSGQVISLGTMPQHDPFYFNGIEDLNLYDGNELLSSTVGSEAWNSRDLKSRPH